MFKNLEVLEFTINNFYFLPNIRGLTNLKSIFINMPLQEFPIQVLYLRQLETLKLMSIAKNNPFELHEHIELLTNLKILDLRHSYVTKLPKSIENLKNLKMLGLYNTPIHELPSQLKKLTNLETIEIGGLEIKPYSNKKVESSLKKLVKALPSLKVNYN
ncbi:Leucine-rich repeat containing protein [Winogradskyella psychrotolerans RS-3]|uniref:Leucine-rich repeat containing protein n=1 Tax=Winogradskyella psychrotolerans RS-3 TaxID=641526 RepID=S7VQ41_9FLAO|nr:hypothetical protein [Winogradskyella psychrotolerans]EPR72111.1 Leucine-rich repeat containing protein [Winogradskyella psychrotolerans RS-3]